MDAKSQKKEAGTGIDGAWGPGNHKRGPHIPGVDWRYEGTRGKGQALWAADCSREP